MSAARFIIGDTRAVTASLPDGSVDLVLTSPPFLALRSYLPADHPDKPFEIGSEATPAEFLQVLLELTAEWRRVLAPHGSICVELGDTYSGSGGAGGDYNAEGLRAGQEKFSGSSARRRTDGGRYAGGYSGGSKGHDVEGSNGAFELRPANGGAGWPMDKSLCGIPHLYHLSLAYGRNLLTGEESPAGRWRVRNVVAWCRPNPPVGALGDKFRPATSYMTIATVARDRYFDLDAVRTPHQEPTRLRSTSRTKDHSAFHPGTGWDGSGAEGEQNPAGAPPLDWWEISTQPYKGSHYATWPPDLCTRPIKAMCPSRVCRTCGEPSRRITEASYVGCKTGDPYEPDKWESGHGLTHAHANKRPDERATRQDTTLGWSDCGHDAWRNGITFDPFAGSGTTLAVATGLGRDALGIDIDARNADLALERVGMFLTVEHHTQEVVA